MNVNTFEEASAYMDKIIILPLSGFVPDHPSLESLTASSAWHTGQENDPWLWRDRFAGEGVAAYGRFFKKKPLLIAAAWFPLFRSACGQADSVEERYQDGKLSKSALFLHQAIRQSPGIDVKLLRKEVGLAHKEDKAEFDKALVELQSAGDVVISGISERLNALGNKNGWNSTCYTLSEDWIQLHGLESASFGREEARERLFGLLQERSSEAAYAFLVKALA